MRNRGFFGGTASLLTLVVGYCCLAGCSRREQGAVIEVDQTPSMEKGPVRTAEKDEWNVQAWMGASRFGLSDPLGVEMRLTFTGKEARNPPKGRIHLKIVETMSMVARVAEFDLDLEDYAKMPKRWETTDRVNQVLFPPQCWNSGQAACAFQTFPSFHGTECRQESSPTRRLRHCRPISPSRY